MLHVYQSMPKCFVQNLRPPSELVANQIIFHFIKCSFEYETNEKKKFFCCYNSFADLYWIYD